MGSQLKQIEIFADGACRGNPGPGGWGALLRYQQHEKLLKGGAILTTNNRMELTAVIEALNELKESCAIRITTDSEYVRQGITIWIKKWKKNGWKTSQKDPVKNIDLWQKLDNLTQHHQISWHWVKGHSNHPENELVDSLAKRAIDELVLTLEK